jgi:hypothetical protein
VAPRRSKLLRLLTLPRRWLLLLPKPLLLPLTPLPLLRQMRPLLLPLLLPLRQTLPLLLPLRRKPRSRNTLRFELIAPPGRVATRRSSGLCFF